MILQNTKVIYKIVVCVLFYTVGKVYVFSVKFSISYCKQPFALMAIYCI